MQIARLTLIFIIFTTLFNCASGYKTIKPNSISYISTNEVDGVKLSYKYNLLDKKYAKKEIKKGFKLVAVQITNNSQKDFTFGKDLYLTYSNGNTVDVVEKEIAYKALKQSPATYLLYLLLTPVNLYTTKTNSLGEQEQTSSTPIGLILGPGIAAGNIIASSSANKKFKNELDTYNINGEVIKQGESKSGLITIRSETFETLNLKAE